jgi:hypothetical protein
LTRAGAGPTVTLVTARCSTARRLSPSLLFLAAACASSPEPEPEERPPGCGQDGPRGTPAEFDNTAGARVDPPRGCGEGYERGAYIRVYGSGVRKIVMGRPAVDTACHEPPPEGAPAEVCPEVFADAFARAVTARMGASGVKSIGYGLGVCGDFSGDYDAWNLSVAVDDWKDADAAVAAVHAELARWGVGNHFGVSVRGIPCIVPD